MKKHFLTLALALILCLTLIPGSAFAADTVSKVEIKFPSSNAVFTLENVAAEYVIAKQNELPVYRIAFPGTEGRLTCNSPANVEYSQTWEDADNPADSGFGGGGPIEPLKAGWSEVYPARWKTLNGKGLATVELTLFDDGTLVRSGNNTAVAYIVFYFGHPVASIGGRFPDDLISYEWRQPDSGGGAGGPSQMAQANLPKYTITEPIVSAAVPVSPPASNEIKVLVNGTDVTFDQPPIIENGRTLVPLRAIFEALGAEVDWNQSTQTVTAVKDGVTVSLKIGSNILTKNGENITLDVPAQIVGSRTLVPVRAVAESFGAEVVWNQSSRTVTVTE